MALKNPDQAAFWQQHVDAQKVSGLSRRAYCLKHGLKDHQLIYYIGRCEKQTSTETAFAQVVVAEPPEQASTKEFVVRLIFNSKTVLEVGTGTDPQWVAQLIKYVGCQR